MNKITRILLLLIALLLLITAFLVYYLIIREPESTNNRDSVSENTEEQKRLIVLISMDGMRSDLIGQETPFLSLLLSKPETAYTLDMLTIEQSETMPSHVSMVTGLSQEHHGFYANSVDETTTPLTSETIFDYAMEEDYAYYAFLTKEKLLYLLGEKSGLSIGYQDDYSGGVLDDIDTMVEPSTSSALVFVHFRDIDTYGHMYGWNSDEQKQAVTTLDSNVEALVADFRVEFSDYARYFVFTADHGGEGTQHSNGCAACRRIPLIVVSENSEKKYELDRSDYNIYDVTCAVLDLMDAAEHENLDCVR